MGGVRPPLTENLGGTCPPCPPPDGAHESTYDKPAPYSNFIHIPMHSKYCIYEAPVAPAVQAAPAAHLWMRKHKSLSNQLAFSIFSVRLGDTHLITSGRLEGVRYSVDISHLYAFISKLLASILLLGACPSS